VTSKLPVEEFLFSAGGAFLFGIAAGYAIKKVMKIAAVVVGLFVAVDKKRLKLISYLEVNTYHLGGEKMICVSGVLVLLVAKSVLTNRRLVLGIIAGEY
jgi:hypothetical protein